MVIFYLHTEILIFTFIQVNNANPKNNSVKVLNRTIAINSFKIPGEINDY